MNLARQEVKRSLARAVRGETEGQRRADLDAPAHRRDDDELWRGGRGEEEGVEGLVEDERAEGVYLCVRTCQLYAR